LVNTNEKEKDKSLPQRKRLRLKDYDYSSEGFYFVTVCAQDRQCLFGEIVGAGPCAGPKMALNDIGSMVASVWQEIPDHYPGVQIDEFVMMPNHIHGIIMLIADGRPRGDAPTLGLSDVIHRFKSLTTARYRHGVKQHNWQLFPGKLWQRGYHERIIRDDDELNRTRQYITDNPADWDKDPENL